MFPLAATIFHDLQDMPLKIWLHLGLGILVIGAVFIILMRMSRILLTLAAFAIVLIVGYQWLVLRKEPAFATPLVETFRSYLPLVISEKEPEPLEEAERFSPSRNEPGRMEAPANKQELRQVEFPPWNPYPDGGESPADLPRKEAEPQKSGFSH